MGRYYSSEVVLYPLKPTDVVILHSIENAVTVVESRKYNGACDHVGHILVE